MKRQLLQLPNCSIFGRGCMSSDITGSFTQIRLGGVYIQLLKLRDCRSFDRVVNYELRQLSATRSSFSLQLKCFNCTDPEAVPISADFSSTIARCVILAALTGNVHKQLYLHLLTTTE